MSQIHEWKIFARVQTSHRESKRDHSKDTLVVIRGVSRRLDETITQCTVLNFVLYFFSCVTYGFKKDRFSLHIWQSPRSDCERVFYTEAGVSSSPSFFRLKAEVIKCLKFKVTELFLWTGSITVLQWPKSLTKLPAFVGNRTCEFLESTTLDQWHHRLSGDNSAETGTGGTSPEALKDKADGLIFRIY